MFRYVAIAFDSSDDRQRAAARSLCRRLRNEPSEWQLILAQPNLWVYCTGLGIGSIEAIEVPDGGGVILGTMFSRVLDGQATRTHSLPRRDAARLCETMGSVLIEKYWGRFVAFFTDPLHRRTFVLRSASGEIDCLHSTLAGVQIFVSGTQHCPVLEDVRFDVNWKFVAADIATLVLERPETGLQQIERVLHGECVVIEYPGSIVARRVHHWKPLQIPTERTNENPEIAAVELRATTIACVNAWASCYNSIIPMLSGGLDSSIVVSLLARAPNQPLLTCLNVRNPFDPTTDERCYARMIAERANSRLVEYEQTATFSLDPILRQPRLASPWMACFEIGDAAYREALESRFKAQALFFGHGGDQVFFQGAYRYMTADFIRTQGLRPMLLRIALDGARMGRSALLPTLRMSMRDARAIDPRVPILRLYELSPLLCDDVIAQVHADRLYIPSVVEEVGSEPTGKCWRAMSMATIDPLYYLFAGEDAPHLVNPLLSQPLQELCMRIPSHVFAFGSRDRGLARYAFRNDLPADICRRQAKGFVSEYMKAILNENATLVRELLLDGGLVKHHIVNRQKLEKALAGDFSLGLGCATNLLSLVSAEAWLRSWNTPSMRAAASVNGEYHAPCATAHTDRPCSGSGLQLPAARTETSLLSHSLRSSAP